MIPLKITYRSPARLRPHPRNARDHSAAQIDKIAASIRSFGFNSPVLVDCDDQIIAGHGRVLAALKLGMDQVPVVAIEHLSANQRRAFMLADNRIAELSTWDDEILALDEALTELSQINPRQSRVVELRYFAGLTEDQVAAALGVARRTVNRDWQMARAWLYNVLSEVRA